MELSSFWRWCMYFALTFSMVSWCGAQIRATPCRRGTFGSPDCRGICHCRSGTDHCRWEDGRCTDGKCSFGWINPPTCQTACPHGLFGYNCSLHCRCPANDVCNSISGLCSSNRCLLGWGGPSCQKLLPVLMNPPDVTATTESQVTLSWPKWITGQTGLGIGNVISHTLQQIDNVTNSWKDVVNLQDSSALMRFTYTAVSLRPNTAYKYRIQLVMDDSGKPLPSVPGPESSRWIVTSCSAPCDRPTNVKAEVIENQKTYIRVTWMPPSLESMNCNGLARHEIFIACISPCVNVKASEEWPTNVSIIEYFRYTNYTINVTVHAINDAGLAGPLSVPFYIVLSGEASTGVVGSPTDATRVLTSMAQSVTTDVTSVRTISETTDVSTDTTTEDVTSDTTVGVTTDDATTAGVTTDDATTVGVTTDTATAGVTTDDATTADLTTSMTLSMVENDTTQVTTGLTASNPLEETTGDIMSAISVTSQFDSVDAETETTWQSEGTSETPVEAETQLISEVVADSQNQSTLKISFRSERRILLKLSPAIEHMSESPCEINIHDVDNGGSALPLSVNKECLSDGVINITGLLPATRYIITVKLDNSGMWRQYPIVLYTAPPPPPRPPTPVVSEVSAMSFKVKLATRSRRARIFSQHLVVTEKLESNKSYFQNAVDSGQTFPFDDSRSIFHQQHIMLDAASAQRLNLSFYVTGVIDSNGGPFVVGDGQTYTRFCDHGLVSCTYSNVPLAPNSSYLVWFVWENSLDGITHRVASQPAGPFLTLTESEFAHELNPVHDATLPPTPASVYGGLSRAIIILIILCVLLFCIIFLVLLIVFFWKRANTNRQSKGGLVHTPYEHPESSSANRELAVSYLNSFLISGSPRKDFDAISGADGDYVIPDACFIYECSGSITSRFCPVPVQKLRDFCSEFLLLDSGCSLEEQFVLLPNCFTDTVNVAWLTCNAIHNRSAQVVPYDRNRVKLKHALPQSTAYINASFVRTIGRRYCIVTQCPTLSTLGHFWQMVWERGTSTIVMLMDSEAPDSLDFDCYWPETPGRYHAYDSIHVELVSVNTFANYTVRHFKIGELNAVRERHVFHWQYMSWSKGGVPEHPIPFLSFVKRIREERKSDSGFLVHCRTGGGRSGVYIAVDTLLTQGHNTGVVDVLRLVTLLHTERSNLVKSFVQYRFIYDCLCEEFDHNPSRYLAERFVMTYQGLETSESGLKTLTDEQQVLVQLPIYPNPLTRSLVSRKSILPEASMSSPNADEDDDLDNLDPHPFQTLSGFIKRDMFIASRSPSATYRDEFWHSIIDNRVNCIVMLNKMADLPDAKRLLPQMGQSVNSKHFSVLCASVKASPSNVNVAYNLKVRLRHLWDEVGAYNVRMFEFTKWPNDDEVPAVDVMLELLEQLRKWLNRYSSNRPILLFSACGSGKSRAALLMVLWYVLEQSENEGVLDIFSTSRLIRSYIINSMEHQEHYHFMYLAVRDYLKRNLAYYTLPAESRDQLSPTHRPGWKLPIKRHSTSASRTISRGGESSTSGLPPEAVGESQKPRLEGQPRKDPLRRNLYHTDLEESEKESVAVTDKGSNLGGMSADPPKAQTYSPESVDVEKPAKQLDLQSGFVSPVADVLERVPTTTLHAGQSSDPVSKSSGSQSMSGQKNSVEHEERHAEALPRPRVRGSIPAKKTDIEEEQGGEDSTIPRINHSEQASQYATAVNTEKSSDQVMAQDNSDTALTYDK